MKIAIAGVGKSGTTALYYKLLNSLGRDAKGLFEPKSILDISESLGGDENLVVKVLLRFMSKEHELLFDRAFDKRILIVRDPRDILISGMLYSASYEMLWNKQIDEVREVIALLREKEQGSCSVSVNFLMAKMRQKFDPLSYREMIQSLTNRLLVLSSQSKSYKVIHYEDMINGKIGILEDYLGIPLSGGAEVAREHRRVIRSKGAGSWRKWFCEEDVELFKPLFSEMMSHFGYDTKDWNRELNPKIDPSVSSQYVIRVINERRINEGLLPFESI
jgi:hypothetical protein